MAKAGQVQHFNETLEEGMGFSAVVHANGLLHLAGIISVNEKGEVVAPGDVRAQIDRIYDIMEETLAKNGATLEHVVSEVLYTTDMDQLMQAISVRTRRYAGYAYPAVTAVQVSALAFADALLEVQATAQLDGQEWSPEIAPLGSPV